MSDEIRPCPSRVEGKFCEQGVGHDRGVCAHCGQEFRRPVPEAAPGGKPYCLSCEGVGREQSIHYEAAPGGLGDDDLSALAQRKDYGSNSWLVDFRAALVRRLLTPAPAPSEAKEDGAKPDPYCVPGPDGEIACPTCAKAAKPCGWCNGAGSFRSLVFKQTVLCPKCAPPAPGGCDQEVKDALEFVVVYQGPAEKHLSALARALRAEWNRPTPAPNREAELKVIEAAKKLNAMWGDAQVNIGPTELALYKALASLAQSEMKGDS